jgi:hypothetical protein
MDSSCSVPVTGILVRVSLLEAKVTLTPASLSVVTAATDVKVILEVVTVLIL